jgi:hypothetical protein
MQAVIYLLTGVALLPASGGIIQAGLKMFGMESRDCVKEINGISPALDCVTIWCMEIGFRDGSMY